MGQKVHPKGFRIGISANWDSRWFNQKEAAKCLAEDIKLRKFVRRRLGQAGVAKIEVERASARMWVNIFTAKPGLVIGRKGKDIEDLKKELKDHVGRDVEVKIIEVRKPDIDSQLVAEGVAAQLERRVNFRRAMKEAVSRAMRMGAEGVKICVAGRLNGAEIARTEKVKEGRVPLHTLRADIDYGTAEARTTYGIIGIKVWIFKGEKFSRTGDQQQLDVMQL